MKQDWEVVYAGNFVTGRLYLTNGPDVIPLNNDGSNDSCGSPRSHQLQSLPHKECNVLGLFSFHFMCVGVLSHLVIGFSGTVLQFTVSKGIEPRSLEGQLLLLTAVPSLQPLFVFLFLFFFKLGSHEAQVVLIFTM